MADLFPVEEFDAWAESYDQSVTDGQVFPFIGYEATLEKVFSLAAPQSEMQILDLGIGTGNLALYFAAAGCQIWGTDFSSAMLAKAREKLPQAKLYQADLRSNWPQELHRRFDYIVSGYVFHHFELKQKVQIIEMLVHEHLKPAGKLIIADISFPNRDALDKVKDEVGDAWEEEFYWLADECLPAIETIGLKAQFHQISTCAGVFEMRANQ